MSTLVLQDLSKHYGKTPVVNQLSLDLREGEFVSLLGPSGCGKTTTLRMIAGFIEPTGGRILMNGAELSSPAGSVPPERRGMSMIFQSYAIWPNMTVGENVAFGLTVRKLPTAEVRERTRHILKVVHLDHLIDRYPAELSGGQQQRVALARAIVIRPQVLLLDEPLSNLDANLREEMRNEIRRLHDEFGMTTVYVTHDQSEAMAISDRIAVMSAGNLEQVDSPWALYNRPRTRFVASFIGRTNLVDGVVRGEHIECEGFSLANGAGGPAHAAGAPVQVSIRPQALALHAQPPAGARATEVTIQQRIYLGEHWDYLIQPAAGGTPLRVAAPPATAFERGSTAWMTLNPDGVAVLPA
ncbi:ABC transporter ATP-binding protein [Achromobacter sp. GG226]|uniref:ABC transporter ATP-binding protein n=1 Tax=Verticiella alkaliphila TaxID=2779529 RepID=UPI001C0C840B|nr:ABC transporter ATP-binding protein [Verticiella sp. GG226]MBU4611529.1 ABC transporter ATP-binding protein [Verticiella sp. GG226]